MMENNTTSKIKLVFFWKFFQLSFWCGISHWCPMGPAYLANAEDTHSDIVTLYPKNFNYYHSCMYIKEVLIAACADHGSY